MAGANSYLQYVFIPQFWHQKLTVKSKARDSEYKPLPSHINLDDICVTKEYRKIRNGHTFCNSTSFTSSNHP